MKKTLTLSACLCLASLYSPAQAKTKHDHGAHEHGIATMNIAWESNQLAIDMVSPAFNIVGFEHQPKNKKQKKLAKSIEKTLNKPASLIAISESSCKTSQVEIESPFHKEDKHDDHDKHKDSHDHHDHGHDHGHDKHKEHQHSEHSEDTHSEYEVAYQFTCATEKSALSLDMSGLFKALPNMQEIRVQWLSATQQKSAIVTAKNSTIDIQ